MKKNSCIVCGQTLGPKKIQVDGYNLLECSNCNTVHTEINTISFKEINKTVYDDLYIQNYTKRKEELLKRFIDIVDYIDERIKGGQLLDVGCGVGLFLELMSDKTDHGWKLFGVDVNKRLIEYSKKNIRGVNFFSTDLNNSNFGLDKFDCITCFDVLEHDPKLTDTLQKLKKLLKKDGLLIIQCPNYESVMHRLTGDRWDWLSLPDHIFHFNPDSLTRLLQKYGFVDIDLKTWEPRKDFVENIRGSLRKSLPPHVFFDAILKLASIPLSFIWLTLRLIENYYPFGGLILIKARNFKP